jgi:dTDP-4-dehydrorhamnose reductase
MVDTVFVTGGSGLLGSNLSLYLADNFSVHSVVLKHNVIYKNPNIAELTIDLLDRPHLLETVVAIKPTYIVHTAALTDVDYCEKNPVEAYRANVEATHNVLTAAEAAGSKVVFVSTDSVFDGSKGMYTETDTPNPVNYYAYTKLQAEKAIAKSAGSHAIVRTNIYGWNVQEKFSLAEWMLKTLKEEKTLTLFSDVFYSPILVNNLSAVLAEILQKNICGIFHAAGSERCSKLEFGYLLAKVFNLNSDLIAPITVNEKKFAAKRPLDTSLNIQKAKAALVSPLLSVEEGLLEFKKLCDNGYVENLKSCLAK